MVRPVTGRSRKVERLKTFLRLFLPFAIATAATAAEPTATDRLAAALGLADDFLASGDTAAAALEYRRLAADLDAPAARPALYLLAAEAYRRGGDGDRLARMLDKAEDAGAAADPAALFLRLRLAESRREWVSAMLYAESLESAAARADDSALARFAAGTRAADALLAGRLADARAAVADDPARLRVVETYAAGSDKSPRVGGLLGLVPGLGYAYSGEWGNMVRSMVLNGLFGWAMYECADRDEWGLFAVATFFELTWYTGSVYGGVDAAHRHNRERLEGAASELRGGREPAVRRGSGIPLLHVDLSF